MKLFPNNYHEILCTECVYIYIHSKTVAIDFVLIFKFEMKITLFQCEKE